MNGDLGFWRKFKYGVLISVLIIAVLGTLEALFVSSLLGEPIGLARVRFVLIATLSYGLAGLILGLVLSFLVSIFVRKPFRDRDSGLAFYFGFYSSLYFLLYAGAWIEFNLFPRLQAFRPPRLPGTIFLLIFTPLLFLLINKISYSILRKVEKSRLASVCIGILAFLCLIIWGLKDYLRIFRQGFFSSHLVSIIGVILVSFFFYWISYLALLGRKFKKEVKLLIKKETILSILSLLLVGGFSLRGETQGKAVAYSKDINVLFITIDALRPDHLSCYGYERRTSPNIDEVAKKGALFTQAITQASYTTTSIASIMTGLYPFRHKVRGLLDQFISDNTTLAEILKEHGYTTGAIVSNPLLTPEKGYIQGFDTYDLSEQTKFKGAKSLFLFDVLTDLFPPRISDSKSTTKEALKWLEKNAKRKFFLWLFYFDTHSPYTPPPQFAKLYPHSADYEYLQDQFRVVEKKLKSAKKSERMYLLDTDVLKLKEDLISLYDAEITYTDQGIGTVLKKLEELGLTENTLIIIAADHGENLGEHEPFLRAHGPLLYDNVLKIPLIFKFPPLIPEGLVLKPQVREIDIMPTILDIAGISIPQKLDGISLLPLILGKEENLNLVSFSETRPNDCLPLGGFSGILGKRRAIRTEEWKLIYTPKQGEHLYELYNLKRDPLELKNLLLEKKEYFYRLKERLIGWIVSSEKETSVEKAPVLDRELKERLRVLGYID